MKKSKRHITQLINKTTAGLLCFLLIFVSFCPVPAIAADTEQKTVRVGWFENLFNITTANGERSGFGYEYQQAVSSYTGWSYEYVQGDWTELLRMLEAGEIDLLSDVSHTAQREQTVLFSEKPMGSEKYYLYADVSHTDISASDLRTIDGKQVGINAGSVQTELFANWMQEHGISATIVPVSGFPDSLLRMEEGRLDCVVAPESSMWKNAGLTGITCIGSANIYFAVNQNRPDLKEELDRAMAEIENNSPYYAEDLYRKYMSSVSSAVLSDKELAWLDAHGPIRIAYLKNNLAFSGHDPQTGELIGAIAEYIRFAKDCLANRKLEFEPVPYDNLVEEMQGLKNREVDMIFHMSRFPYFGEQNGFILSDTVMTSPMAAVSTSNRFNETADNTVAVYKMNFPLKWYISTQYPNWKILDCEENDQIEEYVRSGEADCFVTATNRLNNFYDTKEYYTTYLSKMGKMAFAANRDDTVLMSILNKTLKTMPESLMVGALTMYSNPVRKVTMTDFVKDNILTVVIVVVTVFLIVLLIILTLLKQAKSAEAKAKETAENVLRLNEELKKSQQQIQLALSAAESANQAKTSFLNNMSHDIRTPMNAIIGFTSLAATHLDNKKLLEDYLKKIMTSSNHLLSLINDVLDMSRIESGRIKIECQECHLPTVMHDLRNILQADVNGKRLNILIDTVEVVNEDIVCDKLRLNQVLLNCMSNAIKFTLPGGTVGIRIIQKSTPDSDGFAQYAFVVSDTGIGMSEEFAEHMFEPFTREESSTVNGIPGTGLGMAITKNIVDMMDGTISVKTRKGEGTEITIIFRFRTGKNSHKVTTIKNLEGLRALVADDNMDTCASVTRMLEIIGMNPEWTMSGKEAVYKAKFAYEGGKPYKAFIIDWLMPDLNGVEVVRQIRDAIGDDTPIIILTAYDWTEIEDEARKAGVTAFCAKPLFLSDLYEVLNASVEAEPVHPDLEKRGIRLKGSKVLLVEDNDLNREIEASILAEMGVQVEEAENGKVAVEMVRYATPGYYKLVLMDIQMPVMDGYTATRAIRSMDRPDAGTLPIVAVSANAFEEDMLKSKEAGMNEHIAKPFNRDKLEEVIGKYLR